MKILLTSVGRRVKLIEYFVKEFGIGNLVVCDCDKLAPAMNMGIKYYTVPRIDSENYVDILLDICKKENIKLVISLIDTELELLSKNIAKFRMFSTDIMVSDLEITSICFDKMRMYNFMMINNFKCAKTYDDLEDFKQDLNLNKISFPVIIKPRKGSASISVNKVFNIKQAELFFELYEDLIIQEYLDGDEYGIDVYTDLISKKVISIFAKKKIAMRAGETDKAVSVIDKELFELVNNFVTKLDTRGVIDIDVFRVNGEYYISEVNPRFGGGYPVAYECGENYIKYIKNNLEGNINKENIGNYKENINVVKYDTLYTIND